VKGLVSEIIVLLESMSRLPKLRTEMREYCQGQSFAPEQKTVHRHNHQITATVHRVALPFYFTHIIKSMISRVSSIGYHP